MTSIRQQRFHLAFIDWLMVAVDETAKFPAKKILDL